MGLRAFFHKLKMWFIRLKEPSIPYVDSVKRYGDRGEDKFIYTLRRYIPSCEIKRSIAISTEEGEAELDFLILYNNKLFAVEYKRWKGRIVEEDDGFIQYKTDRWTDEIHKKRLKSPFKQLARAICLLRKQIPVNAWINDVVFFEDDGLEYVSITSDKACFSSYQRLADYIRNEGKESFGSNAEIFFKKCSSSDYICSASWDKSLRCTINRKTLVFSDEKGVIPPNSIDFIRIYHHWYYDELYVTTNDGDLRTVKVENLKIKVNDGGCVRHFSLCKMDYIILGK